MVSHTQTRLASALAIGACALLGAARSLPAQAAHACNTDDGLAPLLETVVDRTTRVPLAGASVVAEWRAGDGSARVQTDSAGKAHICAPHDQAITLRVIYRDIRSGAQPVQLVNERATVHTTTLDVPSVFVRGSVIDEATGSPVANVSIRLRNAPLQVLTDADGRFQFQRIPLGDHTLQVQHISYAAVATGLSVRDEDLDAVIRLTPTAIALQPITVTAFSRRLDGTGFYDREKRGVGTFLARKQIEMMNVLYASDLLRGVPGARLVPQMPRRNVPPNAARGRGNCRYRFIVDGSRTLADFEMDFLAAHAIEGVEIYNGLAEVPAPFRAVATPETGAPTCGVIAIWTRNGR